MKYYIFKRYILIISVVGNTAILTLLAILHFYWAWGGTIWYEDVLPTSSNGLHKLEPSTTATLVIAFGLLFLALMTIGSQGLFDRYIKRMYFRYDFLITAIIFLLRAIGGFKFLGLFKTVKLTRFGINDTHFFPRCVRLSPC
ncbi:DUF3995 domain-containing protein [Chitinophagaceae bacterium LWZ2-11]